MKGNHGDVGDKGSTGDKVSSKFIHLCSILRSLFLRVLNFTISAIGVKNVTKIVSFNISYV